MRPEEVNALGDLAGDAAAGLAAQVREVHEGIAERVFGSLGPAASPVRTIHDRVSDGAYTGARVLTGALVRGGARVLSRTRPADAPSIEETARGRLAVGALNGAWGDMLENQGNKLAWKMTLRQRGRDVELDRASLERSFPVASPRLAIFLHGLCETDDAWRLRADRHVPYGDRLESELHYTPLYVRYNSGLHISHNGRRLAALLDELTANWPVEVSEIALIGHSMGGLVARGACHYAGEGSWREKVRHIFLLGAPNKGAPLELGANAACHAISKLPETRGFAKPLKVRSAGVKDLGYGYVVDEDWLGHDPDAFWTNTGTEVPFLETANHYFVCATLSREADAPVGRLVGDLLVLRPSAWSHGRGERVRFPVEQYSHLGGGTHFDLLNHPAIYGQIKRWLTAGRALPAPAV
jgi:pimeloyl-ACP methyl ester carboxylesterase